MDWIYFVLQNQMIRDTKNEFQILKVVTGLLKLYRFY